MSNICSEGTLERYTKGRGMSNSRTNAVLISSLYLFTPMVFSIELGSTGNYLPVNQVPALGSYLEGMGGPEEEPRGDFTIETSSYSMFGEEEDELGSVTLETRTLNYLKVANTTWPVDTPTVSSDYGWRTPPCRGCSADHKGVDFVPGYGTPVYAATDGMVVDIGAGGGYGVYVELAHLVTNSEGVTQEWTTLYAHMRTNSIPEELKIGSVVKTGEQIGEVGSTGVSTGPHLHFELKIEGENVDPMPLLGTYEVLIVTEEEFDDYMFVGEKFRTVEKIVTYE